MTIPKSIIEDAKRCDAYYDRSGSADVRRLARFILQEAEKPDEAEGIVAPSQRMLDVACTMMLNAEAEAEGLKAKLAKAEKALAGLLAVIRDSDQEKPLRSMRMLGIVSGKPEFAAVDAARAALPSPASPAEPADVRPEVMASVDAALAATGQKPRPTRFRSQPPG